MEDRGNLQDRDGTAETAQGVVAFGPDVYTNWP